MCIHDTFGAVIKQAREALKLTQRDLARLIHVDQSYISKIEADTLKCIPSEVVVDLLIKALDLNPRETRLLVVRHDVYTTYSALIKEYPRMLELTRAMHKNPAFANAVFRLLDLTNASSDRS